MKKLLLLLPLVITINSADVGIKSNAQQVLKLKIKFAQYSELKAINTPTAQALADMKLKEIQAEIRSSPTPHDMNTPKS